jgi:Fe-S cluster assembly protein SufD
MTATTPAVETRFTKEFERFIERSAALLRPLRREAFAYFVDSGFPMTRDEDWKYTNVSPIAKAEFEIDETSDSPPLDEGFQRLIKGFAFDRNGFAALNLAFADIQTFRIAKDTVVEDAIKIEYGPDARSSVFPHVLVIAEAGSRATIVEICSGSGFTNSAIQILVEDSANLTHYRVQRDSPEGFNVGTTEVRLGAGSRYDATSINLGGAISRHDIDVKFMAEGGEAFVDGLYMLGGLQHHDTHSVIDHALPNCISHQTYKGVLNDKSRAVFNGKVLVRENARGTDAQQSNKNLLLSNEARVDTKPQLEIFNDDVKCSHGATVGQLEEEELFYLLTRGLPEQLARNLLTYGFAEQIINKIGIESIKKDLDATVLNRLNTKLEG